jgi:hypothetical protein
MKENKQIRLLQSYKVLLQPQISKKAIYLLKFNLFFIIIPNKIYQDFSGNLLNFQILVKIKTWTTNSSIMISQLIHYSIIKFNQIINLDG